MGADPIVGAGDLLSDIVVKTFRDVITTGYQFMNGDAVTRAAIGVEVGMPLLTGLWVGRSFRFFKAGIASENAQLFHNYFPEHIIDRPNLISISMFKKINGQFNYVVREDGVVIIGKKDNLQAGGGHIDLVSGRPVLAAGEVKVVNGELKFIDNSSGHYLPSGSSAQMAAEEAFNNLGFDTRGKYIEKSWFEDPSLPKGGAWRPAL
jgi:hypothetical protein